MILFLMGMVKKIAELGNSRIFISLLWMLDYGYLTPNYELDTGLLNIFLVLTPSFNFTNCSWKIMGFPLLLVLMQEARELHPCLHTFSSKQYTLPSYKLLPKPHRFSLTMAHAGWNIMTPSEVFPPVFKSKTQIEKLSHSDILAPPSETLKKQPNQNG